MESYSIDTSYTGYTDMEVYIGIKKVIKNEIEEANTPYLKQLFIGDLIAYVSNNDLLTTTIRFLKEIHLLQHEEEVWEHLKPIISNLIYSEKDCTRIRAIVFSALLQYEALMRYNKPIIKKEVPELLFNFKGRNVYHNLESIRKKLHPKEIKYVVEKAIHILPTEKQENEYKKLIIALDEIDYTNSTNYFYRDIKHLEILRDNIVDEIPTEKIENKIKSNPYPRIFIDYNAFKSFELYIENYIIEPHLDYSYLFQRLLDEELIYGIKHKSFMEWLKKEKFIKPHTYQILIEKNQFYTLKKSESNNRMNNFNNVFSI